MSFFFVSVCSNVARRATPLDLIITVRSLDRLDIWDSTRSLTTFLRTWPVLLATRQLSSTSWTRCRGGGGDGAWTFSRRICYAFYRAPGRLHLPLCLSPCSLRPLVHPFLSLYLPFALFVLPSLCFSSVGPPCTISLHPTLIYPSTCLPRRCTPSPPSVNPARTIAYTRTIFPTPTFRVPPPPSHALSLFIPRFHGATQRSAHDEQRGSSLLVTFLKSSSRVPTHAHGTHRDISIASRALTIDRRSVLSIFVGYARRDRLVKST